jgi:energy-coupling factor transporter ATP-binding protein EcfA2
MSTPVFALDRVSYHYQQHAALHAVSLEITAGSRVALLGANGSGKSTLLRLLDGLYFATAGELRAFGAVLSEAALADEASHYAFRRRVGLVFQNPDVQLFNPTVFDELAFGPLQLGWPEAQIRNAIDASLQQFGISHLQQRAPHRLSGGERKRVALASVLIMQPEVLLLDEPTAALDPASQSEVIRFLQESQGRAAPSSPPPTTWTAWPTLPTTSSCWPTGKWRHRAARPTSCPTTPCWRAPIAACPPAPPCRRAGAQPSTPAWPPTRPWQQRGPLPPLRHGAVNTGQG